MSDVTGGSNTQSNNHNEGLLIGVGGEVESINTGKNNQVGIDTTPNNESTDLTPTNDNTGTGLGGSLILGFQANPFQNQDTVYLHMTAEGGFNVTNDADGMDYFSPASANEGANGNWLGGSNSDPAISHNLDAEQSVFNHFSLTLKPGVAIYPQATSGDKVNFGFLASPVLSFNKFTESAVVPINSRVDDSYAPLPGASNLGSSTNIGISGGVIIEIGAVQLVPWVQYETGTISAPKNYDYDFNLRGASNLEGGLNIIFGAKKVVEAVGGGKKDSDEDGISDKVEKKYEMDPLSNDSDNDSVLDGVEFGAGEFPIDSDGDAIIDTLDEDDDNDSIPTLTEAAVAPQDTDEDGVRNHLDTDDDGDSISTFDEVAAQGIDGDTDENGVPNYLDNDDDGDGALTSEEVQAAGGTDLDENGVPNHLDTDDDGDTILTATEISLAQNKHLTEVPNTDTLEGYANQDVDGDKTPNYFQTDSDGDGILDQDESKDESMPLDGIADFLVHKDNALPDSDGDGLANALEDDIGSKADNADSDGDTLTDFEEYTDAITASESGKLPVNVEGKDIDGDTVPNWLDTDTDGDKIDDATEGRFDVNENDILAYMDPTDLVRIDGDQLVILEQINFASGQDTIEGPAAKIISQVALVLELHPEITKLEVAGHTDTGGSRSGNQSLSERRAQAVLDYLVNTNGIDSNRLISVGYGEAFPIDSNGALTSESGNKEDEAKSRRTEFHAKERTEVKPEGELPDAE